MSNGGLTHVMALGSESLANSRAGVEVTGHNIANTNTPGFSRQRLDLQTRDPVTYGTSIFGNGAELRGIGRAHDKYLENQIRQQTETTTEKEYINKGLEKLQGLFNPELTSTVRDRMNSFFNSLRELANYPEEPSVRTNVAESATNLTLAFQSAHKGISVIQNDINDEMLSEIAIFNEKLEDIAGLNQRILEMRLENSNPNDLVDRRDAAIQQVCSLMNVQVTENDRGISIRGPQGSLLVESKYFGRIDLDRSEKYDSPKIMLKDYTRADAYDITKNVTSGRLGGLVKVRDQYGQQLKDELNSMALGFGEAFNSIHQKGYGGRTYEDLKGRDFFIWSDDPRSDVAASFQVSPQCMADPFSISASLSPNSPGDNIIVNELLRLQSAPVMKDGKSSVMAVYDRFVGQLGVDSLRAKEDYASSNIVMTQLKGQKESVSGVSLDEEAANLLKYQQLFQASSRVITTADEMFKTVLELKR